MIEMFLHFVAPTASDDAAAVPVEPMLMEFILFSHIYVTAYSLIYAHVYEFFTYSSRSLSFSHAHPSSI